MRIHYGMAQWQHPAWVNWLYPSSLSSAERIGRYSEIFKTVEVGSSFYTTIEQGQLKRWYDVVDDDFQFCFKAPQSVSHRLNERAWSALVEDWKVFMASLAPLAKKLGPTMLQFPASCDGRSLNKILSLCELWDLPTSLSVEVRHLCFYDKINVERQLLAGLSSLGVDRVIMDSRPVFSTPAYCESLEEAQRKKPRVPCHPVVTSKHPVVRFIGHPDLALNELWLDQWAVKLSEWLDKQLLPYVFVHSSDNIAAPILAAKLDAKVRTLLPDYQSITLLPNAQEQISLW